MMEPTEAIKTAFELWGPVGALVAAILFGGWMALRWLAVRDDARNTKLIQLTEQIATIAESCKIALVNNTEAVHENNKTLQQTVQKVSQLETTVEAYFSLQKPVKMFARKKAA